MPLCGRGTFVFPLLPSVPLSTCPPLYFVRDHFIWFGRIQGIPFGVLFWDLALAPPLSQNRSSGGSDVLPLPQWGRRQYLVIRVHAHCRSLCLWLAGVRRTYSQSVSNEGLNSLCKGAILTVWNFTPACLIDSKKNKEGSVKWITGYPWGWKQLQ